MKKTVYSNIDAITGKANREIENKHSEFQPKVYSLSQSFANTGLPQESETSIAPYAGGIQAFYKGLQHDVSLIFKKEIDAVQLKVDVATIMILIDSAQSKVNQEDEVIRQANIDRSRINLTCDLQSYSRGKYICYFLFIGDTMWLMSPFLRLNDIFVIALIVGVVLAAAQLITVEKATQLIRKEQDPVRRRKWAIRAILIYLVISTILGLLRYHLAVTDSAINFPFWALNPTTFAVLNILMLAACSLVVLFNFPTLEELLLAKNAQALDKRIVAAEKRRVEAKATKADLEEQRRAVIQFNNECAHAETTLKKKIDEYYKESWANFINENLVKRTDGVFPNVFRNATDHISLTATS